MNRIYSFFIALSAAIAITSVTLPVVAQAQEPTPEDTAINRTLVRSSDVTIDDTVNGDLFCVNEKTVIKGTVNGDVLCATGTLVIEGDVTGDVRVIAEKVVLKGTIAGSLTTVATTVVLEEGSTIAGDVSGMAQNATFKGEVGRDVLTTASTMTLSGAVGRDVNTSSANIKATDDATIDGWLRYYGSTNVTVSDSAQVGNVVEAEAGNQAAAVGASALVFVVLTLLSVGITTLLLSALLPQVLHAVAKKGSESPLITLLTGVAMAVFLPIISVILLFTWFGAPLAIGTLVAWTFILLVSVPVAMHALGDLITRDQVNNILLKTLIGTGAGLTLFILPFVNIFAIPLAILYGAGSITLSILSAVGAPRYKVDSDGDPVERA